LPGRELPSHDPENPCFGCGPRNPHGLRMRFFDDGEVVRSELTLGDDYCGWPGTVITNIIALALDEGLTWASWARFGRLATDDDSARVEHTGRIKTGAPFVIEARVLREEAGRKHMEGRAVQDGATRAVMRATYRAVEAPDAERILKRPGLPPSLREDLELILREDASRRS
ncbi:MAG: hypothetical protein LC624_03815, partial [Halobacteriales archaeon]|nr:hypothetical protein [Halobacteriales archaeon]